MERITVEGTIATASTYAHMFSSLPNCGRPTRLMVYDIHTLQNRFYLYGNTIASLHCCVPTFLDRLKEKRDDTPPIDCIAFPDDGSAKRFASEFGKTENNFEIVTCGKVRSGNDRLVTIQEGDCKGKHVVIVDDLVQTGGTLYECGKKLLENGALSVSAYVTHAVFPKNSWKRFDVNGDRNVFKKFWVTNSVPTVSGTLPVKNVVFEVLDIMDTMVNDLDAFKGY